MNNYSLAGRFTIMRVHAIVHSWRRVREAVLKLVTQATWPGIALSLVALYGFGAVTMPALEGPDSPLSTLANYTWWFIVTATTVGYGDISPASHGGRVVAVIVMLVGVGLIAVTVGKIAEEIADFGKRRIRGLTQLKLEGHLVILGYTRGETEALVEELLQDETELGRGICLCAEEPEENPMPDRVKYVRGDLSSDDVLERACVAGAARILVHCRDDNETLVTALAARSVNRAAHLVARVHKEASVRHLKRIDPQIECVRSLSIPLMVHAVQDRGATAVISSLLSHQSDDTIFRMELPEDGKAWTFGELQQAFKARLNATLVAVAGRDGVSGLDINPGAEERVPGGSSLFYIAAKRVNGAVDWGG